MNSFERSLRDSEGPLARLCQNLFSFRIHYSHVGYWYAGLWCAGSKAATPRGVLVWFKMFLCYSEASLTAFFDHIIFLGGRGGSRVANFFKPLFSFIIRPILMFDGSK